MPVPATDDPKGGEVGSTNGWAGGDGFAAADNRQHRKSKSKNGPEGEVGIF